MITVVIAGSSAVVVTPVQPVINPFAGRSGDDYEVIHLRLTVPDDICERVTEELRARSGVAHLARLPHTAIKPPGTILLCDVSRSETNSVVEWLQRQGVHHKGSISIERIDAVVSDAAKHADESARVSGEDVLIWEELEAQARDNSRLTASFLIFISVAAVIALVGIIEDTSILIVAAMVVGPEYGPISAVCVGAARARWVAARRALGTLLIGLFVGGIAAFVAALLFGAAALAPVSGDLSSGNMSTLISQPNARTAVVAVLAGIIGMLSLTEARANALVGVLVSVTTVPAVANAGGTAAYGDWSGFSGSLLQLGINVAGLLLAGLATVKIQSWYTDRQRSTLQT